MSFDVFFLKLTHSPPPVSVSQHNLSEAVTLLRQYVHHNDCSSQGHAPKIRQLQPLVFYVGNFNLLCPSLQHVYATALLRAIQRDI